AAGRRPQGHPQLPALPGLLHARQPLDPRLEGPGPGGGRLRPLLLARRQRLVLVLLPPAPLADAPLLALAHRRLEPGPLLPGRLEAGVGLLPPPPALLHVGGEAPAELVEAVAVEVDLGDAGGVVGQQGPVMADQDDAAGGG